MYNPRRNNEYTICGRQISTYFYLTRGRIGEKISPFKDKLGKFFGRKYFFLTIAYIF